MNAFSSDANAAFRAALAVADDVDPAGRFRAILHLLRCCGAHRLESITQLGVQALLPHLGASSAEDAGREFDPATGIAKDGAEAWKLDDEAVEELRLYLKRRRRRVVMRMELRDDVWIARAICAGGIATRSLRASDRTAARTELEVVKPVLARAARARDSGLLFPMDYRNAHVSAAQVRLWINRAVGRQASAQTRARCAQALATHKTSARRSRVRRGRI